MKGPRLAFFQPDIAGNLGAGLRLAACFALAVEVVEPCGFPLDDRRLRRAGMDYVRHAALRRHPNFNAFRCVMHAEQRRIVLLSTQARTPYTEFAFRANDALLVGQESAGAPQDVHRASDHRLIIPLAAGARSLNVVTALAIVLGEAMRQVGWLARMGERTE